MKHTILLLLKATDSWVKLSDGKQNLFIEEEIRPLVEKLDSKVHVRFFDSDCFNSRISNYLIIETNSLHDYQDFFNEMRSIRVFGEYFKIQEVIMGEESKE